MDITIVKLLFDFGLLVLIWMVQLIIYPSFSYYPKSNLYRWHKKYTLRLGYIVIPLMLGQLILAVLEMFTEFSVLKMFNLGLVVMVWLLTFLQFVPIHLKISTHIITDLLLQKLVHLNWSRTILWTLVFMISCVSIL